MIRFIDKEVTCIGLEKYKRDWLFRYFLDGNKTDIVLIYNGSEYYGMTTYKSVLARTGEDGIIREKYIVREGTGLFADLREMFSRIPEENAYIPVFNSDMQLLYFAFEENTKIMTAIEETAFPFLEQEEKGLLIEQLYPQIKKVCIYDFNEFAFRFYRILKQRNFPVQVFGEKWSVFFPELYEREQIRFGDAVSEGIMNVYAEGTGNGTEDGAEKVIHATDGAWKFLLDIMTANVLCKLTELRDELCQKGIAAFTMIFPDFTELREYSLDEFYRHERLIVITGTLNITNECMKEQVRKCWCKEAVSGDRYEDAIGLLERKRILAAQKGSGDIRIGQKQFVDGMRTVYLIGPCIVGGICVDAEDSFRTYVSKEIQNYAGNYQVECIGINARDVISFENAVKALTLYEGDIVILIGYNEILTCNMKAKLRDMSSAAGIKIEDENDIDVTDILKRRTDDWFWDCPIHTNQRGNAEIAKAVVEEYLAWHFGKQTISDKAPRILQAGKCNLPETGEREILQYIESVKAEQADLNRRTGAIVMNCNPMTNGHRYLIEEALRQVDFLYLFLVEEDKSEFSFAERLRMVQAVTKTYKNMKVIPSGRFVLSWETMPLYFEKAKKQEETLDASWDLKLFGDKIAPGLGINVRFAGEEPKDHITRQYNETMKKLLPLYGVQFVEIPRLEAGREVISASAVRRYLQEGKMDMVRQLVPKEVYGILAERRNSI